MLTLAFSRTRKPIGGRFGAAAGRGLVPRRIHVARRRARRREPQRVVDRAGGDLVVASEAGQDREAGGVGRGPAGRPQVVGAEVEDRARAGRPAPPAVVRVGGEQLVVGARVAVDHDHVPVAGRAVPPSIGTPLRQRVGALVRLARRTGSAPAPSACSTRRPRTGSRSARRRTAPSRSRGGRDRSGRCWRSARPSPWRPGSRSTRWFHGLSAGKIGQFGAPGAGAADTSAGTAIEPSQRRDQRSPARASREPAATVRRRRRSRSASRRTQPRRRRRCSRRRPGAAARARHASGPAARARRRTDGRDGGG